MSDDKSSPGQPTGWKPQTELEHFMQCPVCQKFFDMRKLDEVMEHVHGGKIEMVETFGPPTRRN
jgi:hypothetical protein